MDRSRFEPYLGFIGDEIAQLHKLQAAAHTLGLSLLSQDLAACALHLEGSKAAIDNELSKLVAEDALPVLPPPKAKKARKGFRQIVIPPSYGFGSTVRPEIRELPLGQWEAVKGILAKGPIHKIEAIKVLREFTQWGLRDAKYACDVAENWK